MADPLGCHYQFIIYDQIYINTYAKFPIHPITGIGLNSICLQDLIIPKETNKQISFINYRPKYSYVPKSFRLNALYYYNYGNITKTYKLQLESKPHPVVNTKESTILNQQPIKLLLDNPVITKVKLSLVVTRVISVRVARYLNVNVIKLITRLT